MRSVVFYSLRCSTYWFDTMREALTRRFVDCRFFGDGGRRGIGGVVRVRLVMRDMYGDIYSVSRM